jgi:site-specific recombinase XerD
MTKEEVLAKLKFDVELRGLSNHTQAEYYTKVKLFQNHFDKPATELGVEDVRQFLHYLTIGKKLAPESVNTYNSGLRFLYGVTLNTNLNHRQIPRHRKQQKYPDILTQEEIQTLFNVCDNLRDKCILMTLYGGGLRLSEVSPLKFPILIAIKCSCSFAMLKVAKIDMPCFLKPILKYSELTGRRTAPKNGFFTAGIIPVRTLLPELYKIFFINT